jgi:hypothetical protein
MMQNFGKYRLLKSPSVPRQDVSSTFLYVQEAQGVLAWNMESKEILPYAQVVILINIWPMFF